MGRNDLKRHAFEAWSGPIVILPISSIKYAVQKGDTLQTLAKKFNGDIQEIAQRTISKKTKNLVVGSELMIPDADGSLLAAGRLRRRRNSHQTEKKKKKRESNQVKIAESQLRVDTTGYFIRPLYCWRYLYQGLHGHNGTDIAAVMELHSAAASGQG